MRQTITLREPVQAHQVLRNLWPLIKSALMAGHRLVVEVRPEKRSDAQNALLHASLTEIATTREWCGAKRDVDTWKRLLTAAWLRARGESVEILPALDGNGVDVVFRRTSTLSKAECGELIDFIDSWKSMHAGGSAQE